MPTIEMPTPDEVHRTPQAQAAMSDQQKQEIELQTFMARSRDGAVLLAPVITGEIERHKLDSGQALVAVLLYAAHFARKAGAKLSDFMGSAEQAFGDSEELFASGLVEVLKAARALVVRGWCQGELASKLVKDATSQEGKRRVGCGVKDAYASRWSLLGAVEAVADADSNRVQARDALLLAIRDAGFQFKPGSLAIAVITDYNDYGYVPPLPAEPPTPENASDELKKLRADQRTELLAQWPQPVADPRTKEQVLAVLDRAITISGG